jgi:uncharacterized protein (TIGR03000 family)
MYSVLLLMALSGNAEAPAWGGHGCCGGSYDAYGCCGGYTYDCGGCSGCHGGYGCCGGYSCHGCHGGGHGCHGGFFSGFGGHGCHGCHGGHGCHGCCGGYGCCGGGYGCCGGGYGCCGGGWGCSGCSGYYGGCCGGYAAPVAPAAAPGVAPAPAGPGGAPAAPGGAPGDLPKDKGKVNIAAPASIVVNLPADARLMVDDTMTTSTSEMRRFTSPELAPGRDYHYTLKAEIVRDGQTLTAMERVTVRAGEETQISLNGAKFTISSVAGR